MGKAIGLWLGRIYLTYATLIFIAGFLLLFPGFLLCMFVPGMARFSVWLNKVWCLLFFPFIGMPIIIHGRENLRQADRLGPVVYVSNHGSYLDIPVLTWVLPNFICFLGKHSLGTVPLFGLYFKKFHLPLNRRSSEDRSRSIGYSVDKLKEGRPMVIFPEGTVHDLQPQVHRFRDGAFRIAIEAGVPVVPVTIGYNWYILPDLKKFKARWHRQVVVMHPPIATTGMTAEDVPALSQQVWNIISTQLHALNPNQTPTAA